MGSIRQTALTKAAKGQDCALQIHPYCNGNPETVVFCHFPSEDKGMSIKSPDYWGADGCEACHAVIDGRMKTDLSKLDILECMFRGIYRTWKNRLQRGLIIAKGVND